jgi:hypothetical protein
MKFSGNMYFGVLKILVAREKIIKIRRKAQNTPISEISQKYFRNPIPLHVWFLFKSPSMSLTGLSSEVYIFHFEAILLPT